MKSAESPQPRRPFRSNFARGQFGMLALASLAVAIWAGIFASPPGVAEAQTQCFPGLRVENIVLSPSTVRAGDTVSIETVVKNDESADRSASMRLIITDSSGNEVHRSPTSPLAVPKKTSWWGLGVSGEVTSTYPWQVPSATPADFYHASLYILSEDGTNECANSGTDFGFFEVVSPNNPLITSFSPSPPGAPPTLHLTKGYKRTFSATATDPNNDLFKRQWRIDRISGNASTTIKQIDELLAPTGSSTAEFTYTFDKAGTYAVRATFWDNDKLWRASTWLILVDDFADFCEEDEDLVICGYASEWAHEGREPIDTTLTVRWLDPSETEKLGTLEVTIRDPLELDNTGFINLAVPEGAYVDYSGIDRSFQKIDGTPGVWTTLTPSIERKAQVLDTALNTLSGLLIGLLPYAGGIVTAGDFFASAAEEEPPGPRNSVFQDNHRNCFDQVTVPWVAPRGVDAIRVSIPMDPAGRDYTALYGSFGAYSETSAPVPGLDVPAIPTYPEVEPVVFEVPDLLQFGNRMDPPPCERSQHNEEVSQPLTGQTFTAISSGDSHTCALKANGAAVCWGDNSYGQATPPAGETFISISAGYDHTCGLNPDGAAVCWGNNLDDQSTPPTGETFVAISSAVHYTCGLRSDGAAVCWGFDRYERATPPPGETFIAISAGAFHACGLKSGGEAACWGDNYSGFEFIGQATPPAEGTFTAITAGWRHTCGLKFNGTAVCWGDDSDGQATPPGETFTAISSGWNHTCGLRRDGSATCWGLNTDGEFTPPARETFTAISAGGRHTCGLKSEGAAVCWGVNTDGQATPPSGEASTAVKASFEEFYVIETDLDEFADHDRECKTQLGETYRLADWNDLKNYHAAGRSINALIIGLNWKDEKTTDIGVRSPRVSRDGRERWDGGRRHFFVSRHDHVPPGYFLVHDHINNYEISLGSWYGQGGEVLCYAVGEEITEVFVDLLRDNLEVVYVVDTSGSMAGEKITALKEALEALRDKPVQNTRVALMRFSSSWQVLFNLTERDAPDWTTGWNNALEAITVGGGTQMYSALQAANDLLPDAPVCPTPTTCRERTIVLMSDGRAEDTGRKDTVIDALRDKGVVVDTVAFGADADEAALQEIAVETGGQFRSAH